MCSIAPIGLAPGSFVVRFLIDSCVFGLTIRLARKLSARGVDVPSSRITSRRFDAFFTERAEEGFRSFLR